MEPERSSTTLRVNEIPLSTNMEPGRFYYSGLGECLSNWRKITSPMLDAQYLNRENVK